MLPHPEYIKWTAFAVGFLMDIPQNTAMYLPAVLTAESGEPTATCRDDRFQGQLF